MCFNAQHSTKYPRLYGKFSKKKNDLLRWVVIASYEAAFVSLLDTELGTEERAGAAMFVAKLRNHIRHL